MQTEAEVAEMRAANARFAAAVFPPAVRRAERLRFESDAGRRSVAQHDELIRLCAAGDVDRAAAVACDTWRSLGSTRE